MTKPCENRLTWHMSCDCWENTTTTVGLTGVSYLRPASRTQHVVCLGDTRWRGNGRRFPRSGSTLPSWSRFDRTCFDPGKYNTTVGVGTTHYAENLVSIVKCANDTIYKHNRTMKWFCSRQLYGMLSGCAVPRDDTWHQITWQRCRVTDTCHLLTRQRRQMTDTYHPRTWHLRDIVSGTVGIGVPWTDILRCSTSSEKKTRFNKFCFRSANC